MPLRWLKKNLPKKDFLKDSFTHRIFGERLLDGNLWHINRRSFAGAVALGVFLAFTPTIPFHMLLAALGAIYLRVNLPVAVLTCWLNNPVTVVFIYAAAFKVGKFVAKSTGLYGFFQPASGQADSFLAKVGYLWTGCLVMGTIAAFLSYFLVRLIWRGLSVRKWLSRKKAEIIPFPGGDNGDGPSEKNGS